MIYNNNVLKRERAQRKMKEVDKYEKRIKINKNMCGVGK